MNDRRSAPASFGWFVVATIPFLALVAWHWELGPLAAFGDWAQYMLHAKSIYAGRAYADIGYLFTGLNPFIGPPAQPPGLPAALVPLLALTGGTHDPTPYKLLMVAFSLAFLGCSYIYFNRHGGRMAAVSTVMLTGLWLESGFVTNVVQPDVGFCAFVWAIFCLADREGPWRSGRILAIAVLGLAALAFRVAALPLVPALAVYAWLHRRDVGWRALIPVAVWCACGLIAALAIPGALTFGRLVALEPARLIRNVAEAARVYPFAALDLFLYPFPWNRANDAYHLVIAGFAVIGAVAWFRQDVRERVRLLTVFAVFYIGMLLVLPMQDGRYLMPLAPLAVYSAVTGVAIAFRWAANRLVGRERSADAAAYAAFATAVAIAALSLISLTRQPAPAVLMDVAGARSVFELLRTERSRAPVRAVFVNPRVLTWETGVPAMGFFLANPDTTLAEFRAKRITHVVVGDVGTDRMRASSIARAVEARPEAFRQIFFQGPFTVYVFDSTRAPSP